MKLHALRWLGVWALLVNASFGQPLKQKGVIEFVARHFNPDYVKIPDGISNLKIAFGDRSIRNLRSCLVGYRGWNLAGDWAYSPSFYWELDPQELSGKSRTVRFDEISKYPDLVALYRSIRPVQVSFQARVELQTANGWSEPVWLRVTGNDLIYFGSRSADNYIVPSVPLKWKFAISLHHESRPENRFSEQDESSDVALRKVVADATEIDGRHSFIYLDIQWPDEAIDAIAQLYEAREKKARDEPATAKADAAVEKKRLTEAEEMAWNYARAAGAAAEKQRMAREKEFAERTTPATVIKEKDKLGLKRGNKVVATFDTQVYQDLSPLEGTSYFVLSGQAGKKLIDRNGAVKKIGKGTDFISVERLRDGTMIVEARFAPIEGIPGIYGRLGDFDTVTLHASRAEAEKAVRTADAAAEVYRRRREEEERRKDAERRASRNDDGRSSITIAPSFFQPPYYSTVGISRYTVDSDLSVKKTVEGYRLVSR